MRRISMRIWERLCGESEGVALSLSRSVGHQPVKPVRLRGVRVEFELKMQAHAIAWARNSCGFVGIVLTMAVTRRAPAILSAQR